MEGGGGLWNEGKYLIRPHITLLSGEKKGVRPKNSTANKHLPNHHAQLSLPNPIARGRFGQRAPSQYVTLSPP